MKKPLLYSSVRSPHCLKVAMFLHEKGIDFERVEVDLPAKQQRTPAYLRVNPLGLVPAYADDYGPRADSLLIMHYIEWRHPEPALFPKDADALKTALRWVKLADNDFRDVSHHLYWQLLEPPAIGTDWQEVANLKAQGVALLTALEDSLRGRDYVLGDFSVADVALIPWIHGYRRFDLPSWGDFPAVNAWIDRVSERESYRANHNQKGRPFVENDIEI